jgi:hypothetical protein
MLWTAVHNIPIMPLFTEIVNSVQFPSHSRVGRRQRQPDGKGGTLTRY